MPSRPSVPHALVAVLLAVGTTSTNEACLAQDPPAPPATASEKPNPPRDLVSIAKLEAARESATLHGRIKTLLNELSLRTDEHDPFVANRILEISQLGSVALDDLIKAMDPQETDRGNGPANTALNAARAIARIPGQAVTGAIVRLAREGGSHGRRSAAIAIGLRGDPSLAPVVRELCSHSDKFVVAEAIRAVAALGGAEAAEILRPFVDASEPSHVSRAIDGLGLLKEKSAQAAILSRMTRELESSQPSDAVLEACFGYLGKFPSNDALDPAGRTVSDTLRSSDTRAAAAHCLRVVATKFEGAKRKALNYLDAAVRTSSGLLLEQIAYEMRELGDGSGVEALVAPLDKQIKDDPKNFGLRYQRGEIYLRLKEYAKARRDFADGLKLERDPRQPERVFVSLARCSAALGEERDAEKHLARLETLLGDQDFSTLPRLYPEFASMATDIRFEKLFAPK